MLETIRTTIIDFCLDFVRNPYLCYTEHGLHALFYTMLYNATPEEQRLIPWENRKVCTFQKEYPTADTLGKPQRQHWDVAVVKSPPESSHSGPGSYDYLKLYAVVEFGMNASMEHLKDDIERLSHVDSNVDHSFIVHLYRLSQSGSLFSNRDWSSKSKQILSPDDILELPRRESLEIFYGMSDSTGEYKSGVWSIKGVDKEWIDIGEGIRRANAEAKYTP
jgi:hypothetical protein